MNRYLNVTIWLSNDQGQFDTGKKWKMVGGIALFPPQLNNFCVENPDSGRNKNIVNLEAEKTFAKPVEGRNISLTWILCTEGVIE